MRVVALGVFGLLLVTQPVIAQKPAAAPQSVVPALPTVKPPPLGATPPRALAPVPVAPAAPPALPPAALAPPLPDEAPAIRRLRALFPPDVQMAYRSATVLDEASQRIRLEGVTLRRPDSTVTFDEAVIEGQSETGVRAADLRGIAVAGPGANVTITRLQIIGLVIPRAVGGAEPRPEDLALDRLSLEGLRAETGADGIFTLANLTIEDLGAQRRTRLRLEGLAGEAIGTEGRAFALARAALSGIDIVSFAIEMQNAGQPQPQTGRLDLSAEGFTFSQGGRVVGGAESFRLESETDATQSGTGRLALRGLRFDGMPEVASVIRRLGYQSLVADITMDATFQATGGVLTMPALLLSVPDYGGLTLSMDMDRFAPGAPADRMMTDARLVRMALRYRDEGLLARAIRMQAAEQRITEAQIREQVIAMVRSAVSGPAQSVLREPVERFIRGQARELELVARPPQPLPLGALGGAPPRDAADAQRRFGLTATAR